MNTTIAADEPDGQGEAFTPRRTNPARFGGILAQAADWYGTSIGTGKGQPMAGEPLTVEGVPASINRGTFLRAMQLLGLDTTRVRTVECDPEGLYVTLYTADPGVLDRWRNEMRTHRVFVPLVRGDVKEGS